MPHQSILLETQVVRSNAHYFTSGTFLSIALDALKKIPKRVGDLEPGNQDAIVVILFSCFWFEAYLNEVIEFVGTQDTDATRRLKNTLGFLPEKLSTQATFGFFSFAYRSEVPDRGCNPFQSIELLFAIRNELVHKKPERVASILLDDTWTLEEYEHKVEKRLDALKILAPKPDPGEIVGFLNRVATRAAALWSLNTAFNACKHIVQLVDRADGNSNYAQTLQSWLKRDAKRIDKLK